MTLQTATQDNRQRTAERTSEERAWPFHAKVLALVSQGMSMDEALSLTPADARRYLALSRAWSIPPDRRVGIRMATVDDAPLA